MGGDAGCCLGWMWPVENAALPLIQTAQLRMVAQLFGCPMVVALGSLVDISGNVHVQSSDKCESPNTRFPAGEEPGVLPFGVSFQTVNKCLSAILSVLFCWCYFVIYVILLVGFLLHVAPRVMLTC